MLYFSPLMHVLLAGQHFFKDWAQHRSMASRAAMSAVLLGTKAHQVLRCKGSTNQIYNAVADEQNNAGRAWEHVCVCEVLGALTGGTKRGPHPPCLGR